MSPVTAKTSTMHQRRYHILVADQDEPSLKRTVKLLKRRDYVAAGASTPEEARWWIDGWPIDLILAQSAFGSIDGLQLILTARAAQPELTGLVVGNDAAAPGARRHGLQSISAAAGSTELLSTIVQCLSGLTRRQRWPRKEVAAAVPLRVGSSTGRLMDISYGGLKFELPEDSCVLRSPVLIDVPRADLRFHADVVWSARRADGRACRFGAAVTLHPMPMTEWRAFVDRLA